MAIDPNRVGVRIKSDRWGRRLEHCLTLEGQMGVDPGGWTGEASEKRLHSKTNLEGGEERREEVSSHGCSTFWFALMFSHVNLYLLTLVQQMAQGFPRRRQGADLMIAVAKVLVE